MKAKRMSSCSCPECGSTLHFTEWSFVDSELDLEETYRLTNGTFFKHICPECGTEFNTYHSLNFNDPRSRTLVKYIKNDDLDNKNEGNVSHILLGDENAPDYTIDVLFNPISFMDCIRQVRFGNISMENGAECAN